MLKTLAHPPPVADPLVRDAIRIGGRILLGCIVLVGIGNFATSAPGLPQYFAAYQDLPTSIAYGFYCFAVVPLLVGRTGGDGGFAYAGRPRAMVAVVAAIVGLVALLGHRLVFGGFALSADEFLADFDAGILAAGRLLAPVAPEWHGYLDALQVNLRLPVPGDTHLASVYLPMNAAIRAAFDWLGSRDLATPVLAAASVPIFFGICRQLFPDDRRTQFAAVLMFATSSQFLITAMTPYAMTAHLTFNLAWLWLVLRDRPWSHLAAIPVSFVACGLHQVVFHPLFVAPFLLLFWLNGRRRLAIYYALVMLPIGLFWLSYWPIAMNLEGIVRPLDSADLGTWHQARRAFVHIVHYASLDTLWLMAANVLRFLTWQNPLAVLLVVVACLVVRRWPRPAYALAGGILLTFVAVAIVSASQGHGWGFRYLHGMLGSFVLLAAIGWRMLDATSPQGRPAGAGLLWSSVIVAVALLLPLRAYQAHDFSKPYSVAVASIASRPDDIVVVDGGNLWFSSDLVRNDPFLRNRPTVLFLYTLTPEGIARVCSRYRVALFDQRDAAAKAIRKVQMPRDEQLRNQRLRAELDRECPHLAARNP